MDFSYNFGTGPAAKAYCFYIIIIIIIIVNNNKNDHEAFVLLQALCSHDCGHDVPRGPRKGGKCFCMDSDCFGGMLDTARRSAAQLCLALGSHSSVRHVLRHPGLDQFPCTMLVINTCRFVPQSKRCTSILMVVVSLVSYVRSFPSSRPRAAHVRGSSRISLVSLPRCPAWEW